jgi:predicted small lipoprotein YifL
MKRIAASVLLACLAIGLTTGLSGCGKKGAPEAPGPGDKITYPRFYPTE